MTDPCKDIECIVLSDSDDEVVDDRIRRWGMANADRPAKNTAVLPVVSDKDKQDAPDVNLDGSTIEVVTMDEEPAVDVVPEQSVPAVEYSVLDEHSYAAGGEEQTGDGPRIDEQPTGTPPVEDGGDDVEMEQQLQLQSAPTFSAQLLQQSIAAMKTLLSMRAAGPARKAVITHPRDVLPPWIRATCDPINILQPCLPRVPKSIPLNKAIARIRPAFYEGEEYGNFIFYCLRNPAIGESTNRSLHCAPCGGSVLKANVLAHFLAPEHIQKVRRCGGAVSLPAVQLWLRELQQAKTAGAADAAEAEE